VDQAFDQGPFEGPGSDLDLCPGRLGQVSCPSSPSVARCSTFASTVRPVTSERLRVVGGKGVRAHASHKTSRRYPLPESPQRAILYIGSDSDCRVVLARIVRRLDHVQLVIARTAREGSLLAVSLTPRLIVLDAQLSACDAHDLVVYLRRSAFTGAIPLAVVSGNEGDRMNFIRAGAAAWMTKPLNITQVERSVTSLLEVAAVR